MGLNKVTSFNREFTSIINLLLAYLIEMQVCYSKKCGPFKMPTIVSNSASQENTSSPTNTIGIDTWPHNISDKGSPPLKRFWPCKVTVRPAVSFQRGRITSELIFGPRILIANWITGMYRNYLTGLRTIVGIGTCADPGSDAGRLRRNGGKASHCYCVC
jgi:hypothetical protein